MSKDRVATEKEILQFATALWQEGDVREVRVLPRRKGAISSGYFDSPEKLADATAAYDGKGNAYITLNPVDPSLLARADNRIERGQKNTTCDQEVTERRFLPIDIDPKRPSGVSATKEEVEAGGKLAKALRKTLDERGWPEPIICFSGNGHHLLYPLALPNSEEAHRIVEGALRTLSQEFSTPEAAIDVTLANASRIIALPGTLKIKGDSTEERPHRRARILNLPEKPVPVTRDQLEALCALPPDQGSGTPREGNGGRTEPLEALLSRHGIEFKEQAPDRAGIVWYHVKRCPFHEDGENFECGVGQAPDGCYTGKCFHPEGDGEGWQGWKEALGLEVGRNHHNRVMVSTDEDTSPSPVFPRTDAGNGELFAHLYQDQVRFDHRLHRYLLFSGERWREDAQAQIRVLAKKAARYRLHLAAEMSDDAQRQAEKTYARQSENKQRLEAMLLLGQSEDPIANDGEHWDEDPTLLGVENGVLDLALGRLRAGRPEDRITLHTPIRFDPDATCPRFERFLAEIFEGNLSLIDFTGRATGYSLTAHTHEQAFFFCSGVGANGKGILFSVLRLLLGDYAQNLPFQSLEQQSRGGIPNDIASIVNRRLVTVAETNRGSKLDEALLKTLTGEDVVTARFMRKEYFNFVPVAKFWLAANHKPDIKDISYGFWRRILVVPFNRVFAKHERDPHLLGQLKEELPGILAWAVRGCAEWQRRGLDPPDEVSVATEEYRLEVDSVGRFIAEACLVAPEKSSLAGPLYDAYRHWAQGEGLDGDAVLDKNSFGSAMKERFQRKESNRGRLYQGIGVRPL